MSVTMLVVALFALWSAVPVVAARHKTGSGSSSAHNRVRPKNPHSRDNRHSVARVRRKLARKHSAPSKKGSAGVMPPASSSAGQSPILGTRYQLNLVPGVTGSPPVPSNPISQPPITVSPGGWIHYNESLVQHVPTQSSQTLTMSGKQMLGGGCIFKGTVNAPEESDGVVEEETAYNPVTCEQVVVRVTVTDAELAELEARSGGSTDPAEPGQTSAGAPTPPSADGLVKPATSKAVYYKSAHTKVQWIDPLTITITSLNIDLSWPLNFANGPVNSTVHSYEFPYDSWSNSGIKGPYKTDIEGLYPGEGTLGGSAETLSGWESSAHETFYNSDFIAILKTLGVSGACAEPEKTTEYYHSIKVFGYSEGPMGYYWEDSNKGACSNLVHHVAYYGWGWDGPESEYITGKIASHNEYEQESSQEGTVTSGQPPVVNTSPASGLSETQATLGGSVDPDGLETHYYFQYGTTTSYGTTIPAEPGLGIGSGSTYVPCYNAISGLTPGAEYHYRLVGVNSAGTSYGGDQSFRTPRRPTVATEPATELRETSAVLHGSVNPNELDTHYYFQYGTTTSYGSAVLAEPGWDAGSGSTFVSCYNTATDLKPGTTYHYRVVASNWVGPAFGRDQTFTTPEQPDVFFADANDSDEMSSWTWSEQTGWQMRSFLRDQVAPKSSPSGLVWNGTPNVFFADKNDNGEISDWAWSSSSGWQLQNLFQDEVQPGTSPAALMINGDPNVFFSDKNDNGELSDWNWNAAEGWHITRFFRDAVATGTSPSAMMWNGKPYVFFSDKNDNGEISVWTWNSSSAWEMQSFYQHELEPETSPSALVVNGTPEVFFSDKDDNGEVSDWNWNSTEGWHITPFYRDAVATGTSPSAMMWNGKPYVFFSDKNDNGEISVWTWNSSSAWEMQSFYQHELEPETSPSALVVNGTPEVFFSDKDDNGEVSDWNWNSTERMAHHALLSGCRGARKQPLCIHGWHQLR